MSIRRDYNDLLSQRAQHLAAAEDAMNAGDRAGFEAAMAKAKAMDGEIDDKKALIDEQDRYARAHAPKLTSGESERDRAELGRMLAAGEAVTLSMRGAIGQRDAVTVASGGLTAPTGAGSEIRDGFAGQVSSLVDQVQTIPLTGLSSYEEPYVVTDPEAKGGKMATVDGTARTDSDPAWGKAAIKPYELSVTSYVSRSLSRLNPADYFVKVQTMAMRALRRKTNSCIVNGDGQSTPDMYGITTAKNTAGQAIFASVALGEAVDANTLDALVYAYGGDEELGGNARLLLTKSTLKALGALRGTNEKQRLYRITPDAGNPNCGVIEDGGLVVPYTIVSALGDSKLAYGDPYNYELGLFGDYTIRIDESVKAVERMNAILGDVLVGGNLIVDKGFVIGTIGG